LQDKLSRGEYKHPKEFKHDVNLVWHNCMTYNVVRSCSPRVPATHNILPIEFVAAALQSRNT